MSNQLFQLLGSYDLFGKAVPGAALLFGLWLLLPSSDGNTGPISSVSFVGIAALLIILLLGGLMVGQGLHTLADNIEKAFSWFLIAVVKSEDIISTKSGLEVDFERLESPDISDQESYTYNDKIIWDTRDGFVNWIRNRFWGIFDSLVSHRYLFHSWIVWNYPTNRVLPFDDRDIRGRRNIILERFVNRFEGVFDEKIIKLVNVDRRSSDNKELKQVYALVTSYLSAKGITGHRKYQSIYSFCRSLWVVFFLLTILYSLAIFQPIGNLGLVSKDPILLSAPSGLHPYIPIVTGFAMVVFFDASGTYKNHYVEYLIVSFVNSKHQDNQQQSDENPETSNPRDIYHGSGE